MNSAAASFFRRLPACRFALAACGIAIVFGATGITVVLDERPSLATPDLRCGVDHPDPEFASQVASSPRHAEVWRLYQAYFLRQPDVEGLRYWTRQYRDGTNLDEISRNFAASSEFVLRYGALDDRAFLELVYRNVMCRSPDAEGYECWLNRLQTGSLHRGELMTHFSESVEYIQVTGIGRTPNQNPHEATLQSDDYELVDIPGGLAIVLNYDRIDFSAGSTRCSVASINGNWFLNPGSSNPTPTGLAIVDGKQLDGAEDREDRGVFGERYRPNGPAPEQVLAFRGGYNINSNLATKDGRVLESWMGWRGDNRDSVGEPSEWRWAAAGIPLINNGQVWPEFERLPTTDYTHYTTRHSFVAFDKDATQLLFGSTFTMTSADLIHFAVSAGYDDLIKFDGGTTTEFNLQGEPAVGGTTRNVPLWLGIGC